MLKFVSILILLVFSSESFSAKGENKGNRAWKEYENFFTKTLPERTEQTQISVSDVKVEDPVLRSTASINESSLSPEFKTYRDRISKLGKDQVNEFNKVIEDLDTSYTSLKSNDTKLLAAFLVPLKSMRGLLWNLGQIAEGQAGQSEMLATIIRGMYLNAVESKDVQAALILNYLLQPYDGMTIFNSNAAVDNPADYDKPTQNLVPPMVQLQNLVNQSIYSAINTMAKRISSIDLSTPVPVDLKAMFPNLPSGYPRFTVFGQKEQIAVLSMTEIMLARISIFMAYDYTNYAQYLEVQMFRFNQIVSKPVGLLLEKSNRRVKDFGIYKFTPNGKTWLARSFDHYKNAYNRGFQASPIYMNEYRELLNSVTKATQVNVSEKHETSQKDISAMIEGQAVIINQMNGRPLKVDMLKFFTDPPDSYSLFPEDYVGGEKYITKKVNGKQLLVFNPEYGRPSKWKLDIFQKFFPGATEADIPHIKSILLSFGIPYAIHIN